MKIKMIALLLLLVSGQLTAQSIKTENYPALQQPMSNNAVTLVATEDGPILFSFLGLGASKTWEDIKNVAAFLKPGAENWTEIEPVPGPGRLARLSAISVFLCKSVL